MRIEPTPIDWYQRQAAALPTSGDIEESVQIKIFINTTRYG